MTARARVSRLSYAGALAGALACASCGKKGAPADAAPASVAQPLPASAAPPARTAAEEDLWTRARDAVQQDARASGDAGDASEDDLARLARREGIAGLIERGAHPAWRATAARALGYTEGFAALAWLGEVAKEPDDADALPALESAVDLASQKRRSADADDAEELRAGCDALLAIARDPKAARRRRVLAVRALRMLTDKGCVKPGEIPADVDAR